MIEKELTPYEKKVRDALEQLRKDMAAIETKYSAPEMKEALDQWVAEKAPLPTPAKLVSTKRQKKPKQNFVKMLPHNERYFVPEDKNYIRYFFMEWLRKCKYDVAMHEYPYMGCYMDILGVVAGRAIEYEIKASRTDYEADFSKVASKGTARVSKHGLLISGETIVSKFFFIVPKGMIAISECPKHAGLIEYTIDTGLPHFQVVKIAPMLSKAYLSAGNLQGICARLQARNWNLTDRYVDSGLSIYKNRQNAVNNLKH